MQVNTCIGSVSQTHHINDYGLETYDIHSDHNISSALKLEKISRSA